MFKFFRLNIFLIFSLILLLPLMFSAGVYLVGFNQVLRGYFIFDSLSFYLVILVVFLGVYSVIAFQNRLSVSSMFFLTLRLVFSSVCFCVNHSILFWCFYELSMLPLLYLIFRDSPYSERFIAGWYFAVYLLITRLPLILILLYLSFIEGRFFFNT